MKYYPEEIISICSGIIKSALNLDFKLTDCELNINSEKLSAIITIKKFKEKKYLQKKIFTKKKFLKEIPNIIKSTLINNMFTFRSGSLDIWKTKMILIPKDIFSSKFINTKNKLQYLEIAYELGEYNSIRNFKILKDKKFKTVVKRTIDLVNIVGYGEFKIKEHKENYLILKPHHSSEPELMEFIASASKGIIEKFEKKIFQYEINGQEIELFSK